MELDYKHKADWRAELSKAAPCANALLNDVTERKQKLLEDAERTMSANWCLVTLSYCIQLESTWAPPAAGGRRHVEVAGKVHWSLQLASFMVYSPSSQAQLLKLPFMQLVIPLPWSQRLLRNLTNSMEPPVVRPRDSFPAFYGTRRSNTAFTGRVPVTTAWRVLGLRMEERPAAMEGSCEYIE
jgi:hypothetical protein